MPIEFACACGKKLTVHDEHAGKKAKCPGCASVLLVPVPEPAAMAIEVLDDPPRALAGDGVRPGLPPRPPQAVEGAPAGRVYEAPKKQKKDKQKPKDDNPDRGDMARMYLEHAEKELKRKEKEKNRPRARAQWGGDGDGGLTLFGVHLSAATITGAGMFILGILSIIIIALFPDISGSRIMIGAVVCTAAGAITFIKAVFFGEEE